MKKYLPLFISILFYTNVNSQIPQLWGCTFKGGSKGGGSIIKINGDGSGFQEKYPFTNAYYPIGNLMQATNGLFFGIAAGGGVHGTGTIFTFNSTTNTYSDVYEFITAQGYNPAGSLIQATDGKLYGVTQEGGANYMGVIFSYDPVSSVYTDLFDFSSGSTGVHPVCGLMQANNGLLYGLTSAGGPTNAGGLFSYNISSHTYREVHDFTGNDGYYSTGQLIQASDNKLYGMSQFGGLNGWGNIFSYDITADTVIDLIDFDASNAAQPPGGLIQATNGLLYGMSPYAGAGNIFSYDIPSNSITTVYSFSTPSGEYPQGSLIQHVNGKLYGLTQYGGTNSAGVLFSFDPATYNYSVLYNFYNSTGANPSYDLMMASNGKFYSMAQAGGPSNAGVLFSFNITGNIYSDLHDFPGSNGDYPENVFMQANNGNIYGTTYNGGTSNAGTIFKYNPVTNIYTTLVDLDSSTGDYPLCEPMQASDGKLYGMTTNGGIYGFNGVIYSLDLTNNNYSVVHQFNDTAGSYPWVSHLIQWNDGKLYGMTNSGGTSHEGVLFSYDPVSQLYSVLHNFGSTGSRPYGSLLKAANGLLYGTTARYGVHGDGTIFSFDPASNIYTDVYDFNGTSGADPHCDLIQASNGKLYGTAVSGGLYGLGVIFSYDISNNIYTDIFDFDGPVNGSLPLRSLMLASNGMIYGEADAGPHDQGVLFMVNPSTNAFTKLMDFNWDNGSYLMGLIEFDSTLLNVTQKGKLNEALNIYPNPTHSTFTISFNGQWAMVNGQLTIFDITGRVVHEQKINSPLSTVNCQLNAGVYFVKVQSGEKIITEKLVVE